MSMQPWTRNEIDMKIIGLLIENARRNFAEIGKEVGISKNAAWSRYKNMAKAGVIKGATVQINYKKLGYDAVGTLLINVEPSQVEQASKYIRDTLPDAFGPFSSASRHNLRAVVTLKTLSELGNIKEKLRKTLPNAEIGSIFYTDVWFTPENLSLIPIRPTDLVNKKTTHNSKFKADETDLLLIKELTKDSRISFRTLSKRLGISIDTVARRYKKLTTENIIVSRIQINPTKIGYSALALFYLRVTPQYDVKTIISEILTIPDVFYTMMCTGDFNVGVVLMVKSIQDMIRTGDFIAGIKGLKTIETVTNPISDEWPLPRTYTSTLSRNLIIN